MTRADRIERMLRAMDRQTDAKIAKLRGTARPAIEARIRTEAGHARTVFLVALATVSDVDLGALEEELGIPRYDPPPRRAIRRTPVPPPAREELEVPQRPPVNPGEEKV